MQFSRDTTDSTVDDHGNEPPITGQPEAPRRSTDPPLSCDDYERLIGQLEGKTPTEEDLRRLAQHESSCVSGRHTEEGLAAELDLPRGALRNGSPEDGLEPPEALIGRLVGKYLGAD